MKQHVTSGRHTYRMKEFKSKDDITIENVFEKMLKEGSFTGDKRCSIATTTTASDNDEGNKIDATDIDKVLNHHKQDFKEFMEWKMLNKAKTAAITHHSAMGSNISGANEDGNGDQQEGCIIDNPMTPKIKHIPNPKSSPKRVKPRMSNDDRKRKERDWQFIPEKTYQFYVEGTCKVNVTFCSHGIEFF